MANYDIILNSYAVVILDLLPAETRIKYADNPADLLPMIQKAIKKFIHDNDVATTAEEFGIKINRNLDDPSDVRVPYKDIMKSYKTTIVMLASQEVKDAIGFFDIYIDGVIRDVSVEFAKNYTNTNLETFRIGGSSPIRTQILDELTKFAIDSKVPTGKTRKGGRSRSNKRSVYRRRRSSKRQSRKVSKARSTRRK